MLCFRKLRARARWSAGRSGRLGRVLRLCWASPAEGRSVSLRGRSRAAPRGKEEAGRARPASGHGRRMGCCFSSSEAAREADAAGYAERRERMLAAAEEREAAQFKGISAKVETIARHSQGGRRVPSGGVGRALRRGWDVCFGVLLRAQERRGQTAPRVCKRAREAAQQK